MYHVHTLKDNIKISIFLYAIYRIDAIPMNVPSSYFVDIDNLILKFIWKGKTHLLKKEWSWRLTQFQDGQDLVHQDTVVLAKGRSIDQLNRVERPEIDPKDKIQSPDFWQSGKGKSKERGDLSTNGARTIWRPEAKSTCLNLNSTSFRISSPHSPISWRMALPSAKNTGSHLPLIFPLSVPEFSHRSDYVEAHSRACPPRLLPFAWFRYLFPEPYVLSPAASTPFLL